MSDTDLTLTLANGLERAVYIQGERTFMLAIRVWPPDGEVSCRSSAFPVLTTELVSSSRGASKFVAIEPDKRVKVVVPTTFPQQYKGGRCAVSLHLKDGASVGPVEFRPQ